MIHCPSFRRACACGRFIRRVAQYNIEANPDANRTMLEGSGVDETVPLSTVAPTDSVFVTGLWLFPPYNEIDTVDV
ncbi:MAG: hypothetical protein M3Z09_05595 [Acidobacteriota bacterium]|nr:hypothetical protein [Acidobacteriota bacterium]